MGTKKMAERAGFEPAVRLLLRQFSKLLLSATQPPLRIVAFYNIYHFYCKSSPFSKKIQNFLKITVFWSLKKVFSVFFNFFAALKLEKIVICAKLYEII